MKVILKQTEVKTNHLDLYNDLVKKLLKKDPNIKESDIRWEYSYGVMIGGIEPDFNSLEEYINYNWKRTGLSLYAIHKRKNVYKTIDEIPKYFRDKFTSEYEVKNKQDKKEEQFVENMDYVLGEVGKKGSSKDTRSKTPGVMSGTQLIQMIMTKSMEDQPVYPTLMDMGMVVPEICIERKREADGTKLVLFSPNSKEHDEWGFRIEEILGVIKNLDTNKVLVVEKSDGAKTIYNLNGDMVHFSGFFNDKRLIKKVEECKPGEKFKFSDRRYQKLSIEERDELIVNKIFIVGKISL